MKKWSDVLLKTPTPYVIATLLKERTQGRLVKNEPFFRAVRFVH